MSKDKRIIETISAWGAEPHSQSLLSATSMVFFYVAGQLLLYPVLLNIIIFLMLTLQANTNAGSILRNSSKAAEGVTVLITGLAITIGMVKLYPSVARRFYPPPKALKRMWRAYGLFALIAFTSTFVGFTKLLPDLPVSPSFGGYMSHWWLTWMLVHFVAAAVFEELVFRGILFTAATAQIGVGPAIALSASIFFASHYIVGRDWSLYSAIPIATVTLVTSILRIYTPDITLPTLYHVSQNLAWASAVILLTMGTGTTR